MQAATADVGEARHYTRSPTPASADCVIQVPGYLIKREIGAGGMATVYSAVQTSLEREVALKVMNPAMVSDPTFSRRFMQEARTLASLAHPNIVAVYDVGITDEKLHYFSMQHLPHGDFLHRIREGIGEREVLRVVVGVARALGFAHQRGFVHRDVAPGNVLFDFNNNPVLTDFGIARAVSKTSRITNAGVSVGTSHYMSPEQARGGDVDGRSDLYSLGAVIYEALTGHAPYDGDDGFAIAYAHVFEPVPRLPQHLQHWQLLIDRAMSKDPAQRFQNAEEFTLGLGEVEKLLKPQTDPNKAQSSDATVNMAAPSSAQIAAAQFAAVQPHATMTIGEDSIADELKVLRERAKAGLGTTGERALAPTPPARRAMPWAWLAGGLLLAIVVGAAVFGVGKLLNSTTAPVVDPETPPMPMIAADPPRVEITPSEPALSEPAPTEPMPTEPTPTDPAVAALDEPSALELLGIDAPDIDENLRLAIATTVVDPVAELTRLGRLDLAQKRLTLPPGRNATDRFRLLLRIDRNNAAAKAGLLDTAKALLAIADADFAAGRHDAYFTAAARAVEVAGLHDVTGELKAQILAKHTQLADIAIKEGDSAIARWDGATARKAYERALSHLPDHAAAQRGLKLAAVVGKPGYVFSDKRGSFTGPELMIAQVAGMPLAVARNETTVAEFQRFWSGGGAQSRAARPACRDRESIFRSSKSRTWQAPGFSQDANHPVVCVAYADVEAYAVWLSKQTGSRYRALTAAEWTALAAQTADANRCRANVADATFNTEFRDRQALACSDGFAHTAPARRFDAPGGLYDLAGNVREWVSDCGGSCSSRVAMGSAWLSVNGKLDAKQRDNFDADTGFNTIGFRVVREID